MRVEFHPQAFDELRSAIEYYEQQQAGLGTRFLDVIEASLDTIASSPESWPLFDATIHRYITRIFPYALLYSIDSDRLLIIACMHLHQKPGYWRLRITP